MAAERIYLDHAAQTPPVEEALAVLRDPWWLAAGNPSSPHTEGRALKDRLEAARDVVAGVVGCRPREIVFTGGLTEGLGLLVRGLAHGRRDHARRLLVGATEHPGVQGAVQALVDQGFEHIPIPVDADGILSLEALDAALEKDAALVVAQAVNHEMGARQPLEALAQRTKDAGVPWICDMALAPGRMDIPWKALDGALLAFSGPHIGGVAGSGFVRVPRGVRLGALPRSGLQEEGLRPGMESVGPWCALAAALQARLAHGASWHTRTQVALDALWAPFAARPDVHRLGRADACAAGILAVHHPGVEGEAFLINADLGGVAIASGSTCALGSADPSPGLLAMGMSTTDAACTSRWSTDARTTPGAAADAARVLQGILDRLQHLGGRRRTR